MKLLPIGIQDFEKLLIENYFYIDKTKEIYELITSGNYYFIARPRRFGKSLLLSTIKAIFQNKRDLFKGLWIDVQTDYAWQEHPVIHLSFMTIDYATPERLERSLLLKIQTLLTHAGASFPSHASLNHLFELLVQLLSKKEKVVLLIDEYDKPIIDHVHTPEVAEKMREILRTFYGVIKDLDPYLRLVFITGVSKFAQTSIFSGMNNLDDLTVTTRAATLCGATKHELKETFSDSLQAMAEHMKISFDEVIERMTEWYDGYRFDLEAEPVYNIFSVINALANKRFNNYWIRTGTPTFLIELFKKGNYIPQIDPDFQIAASHLEIVNFARVPFIPLLYQTGYLTLRESTDENRYRLDFPNREVSESFVEMIASGFFERDQSEVESLIAPLRRLLQELNIDEFFERLKTFYAQVPYTVAVPDREKHYQTIFYVLLKIIGLKGSVEVPTNQGRIDFVLELKHHIFIFEFKIRGTAEEALEQIKRTHYVQKYQHAGKQLILIGALFNIAQRNIESWAFDIVE